MMGFVDTDGMAGREARHDYSYITDPEWMSHLANGTTPSRLLLLSVY